MAKEKFLIIASPMMLDCFGAFSETANRAAIDDGTADESDPYGWIEQSFEIRLVRWREATHICSFTPSARYTWIQNYFVGLPNEAWERNGDPKGLEYEAGGELGGYGTYRDDYDKRFICETFTVDSMKHCDGLRKPRDTSSEKGEAYLDAIWKTAEETASEIVHNGGPNAPILEVFEFRKWERERRDKVRQRACEQSKRNAATYAYSELNLGGVGL